MRVLAMSILLALTGCSGMTEAERDQHLYEWQEACVTYLIQQDQCNQAGGAIYVRTNRPLRFRGDCPREVMDMRMAECVRL